MSSPEKYLKSKMNWGSNFNGVFTLNFKMVDGGHFENIIPQFWLFWKSDFPRGSIDL